MSISIFECLFEKKSGAPPIQGFLFYTHPLGTQQSHLLLPLTILYPNKK